MEEMSLLMPALPEEIIQDILARMPAKEVLRCRCLSHAWAATLSSEYFVERHLMLANRGDTPRLVISQGRRHNTKLLLWSPENANSTPIINFLNKRLNHIRVLTKPCHGLVLLQGGDKTYYICNLSIREIWALPTLHIEHTYGTFGFGYDSLTKEYKVVRLFFDRIRNCVDCEVFAINGTGHWRPAAGGGKLLASDVWWRHGIFAHGNVHWIVCRRAANKPECFIISFSMRDEMFGSVQPPPGLNLQYDFEITELDGCLCLFSTDKHWRVKKTYDMWILKDYDACVWELHCRVDATRSIPEVELFGQGSTVYPLAFIGDHTRILFLYYKSSFLVNRIKRILFVYSVFDHQMRAYSPVDFKILDDFVFDDERQLIWVNEESLVKVAPSSQESDGGEHSVLPSFWSMVEGVL